jgi:hypothetical protein
MLTLNQAADRLGVGPWVVRQLITRGILEATQVVPCAPWQLDPAVLDTEAIRHAAQAVQHRTGRPGSRLADPTRSRFRAFDERLHNVTAPRGASTPWYASNGRRGGGTKAARISPLRIEPVAWVSARGTILGGLLALLTVLAYLRA